MYNSYYHFDLLNLGLQELVPDPFGKYLDNAPYKFNNLLYNHPYIVDDCLDRFKYTEDNPSETLAFVPEQGHHCDDGSHGGRYPSNDGYVHDGHADSLAGNFRLYGKPFEESAYSSNADIQEAKIKAYFRCVGGYSIFEFRPLLAAIFY